MLEHVGGLDNQIALIRECARVARKVIFLTTPNRWFPVEQHLLTPFVHWLPKPWQRWIVPRFTVWGAVARPSDDRRQYYLEHYLEEVRLLGTAEMRALFPGARLIRERFGGWTKSLVAMRK